MTVELAVDNVATLPIGNLRDIPSMMRKLADAIDAGEHGTVDRVVCLVEHDEGIAIMGWGESTTAYELMGLFEASKLRVFAEDLSE